MKFRWFEALIVGMSVILALASWGASLASSNEPQKFQEVLTTDDVQKEVEKNHRNYVNVFHSLLMRIERLEKKTRLKPQLKYKIIVDGVPR